MGTLDGKVALITGAARGVGRSHAVRLAQEGADIIAVDALTTPSSVTYELADADDFADTKRLVEEHGRRAVTRRADVRDFAELDAAVAGAVRELGGLDIVVVNAGIFPPPALTWEIDPARWRDVLDVNLTGAFHTVKAAVPHVLERGAGGSVVLTSSGAALVAGTHFADYSATKAALLSLTRTLASELGPHSIRVNAICPTTVNTAMVHNENLYRMVRPDLAAPGAEDIRPAFEEKNLLPVPWVEPTDVSNAVAWLVSEQARYITGVVLPVDAGNALKE